MTDPQALQFSIHEPSAQLRRYVRYFWTLRGVATASDLHPILPDGSPELIFNLGARVLEIDNRNGIARAQPDAMLVGQMTRPVTIQPTGTLDLVGVRLTPWGAPAFVSAPGALMTDRTWSLAELGERALASLAPSLRDARTNGHLQLTLESLLSQRLQARSSMRQHQLEKFATALASVSSLRIDDWSRAVGCSTRSLERHFDTYVGVAPKEFQRLRRFQQALRMGTDDPSLTWSTVAHRAGYADQSHLIREFRQFAGVTPRALREAMTEVSAVFVDEG